MSGILTSWRIVSLDPLKHMDIVRTGRDKARLVLYFIACSLLCNNSVTVMLFCGGLIVVGTQRKMPCSASLLSRKAATETVRNAASFDMVTLAYTHLNLVHLVYCLALKKHLFCPT